MKNKIDFGFIRDQEGGDINKAYVPDAKSSQSGVTIGTGFDLGCRNCNELEHMGFSSDLIKKLEPYLGLKGTDAQQTLSKKPLSLTDSDLSDIDQCQRRHFTDNLIKNFNHDSKASFCFNDLPPEGQTVIASVAYQYGSPAHKTPSFWQQVTTGNWQSAYENLMEFGDRYPSRRKREASLWKKALDENSFPGTDNDN